MKTKFYSLLIISILCLSSCKFFSESNKATNSKSLDIDKKEVATKYVKDFINAVNAKNYDKFYSLLSYKLKSESSQYYVENLDEKIQSIFNIFSTTIYYPNDYTPLGGTSSSYHLNKEISYFYDSLTISTKDGKKYELLYNVCYLDDYYERNEGFIYIKLTDENNKTYEIGIQ